MTCVRTALVIGGLGMLVACRPTPVGPVVSTVAPPTTDSIRVPQIAPDTGGGVIASWLEPQSGAGYRFRMAFRHDSTWSSVTTIVADDSIFMHPTDLPSVTRLSSGALAAVWQRRVNKATSGDGWQYEFRVQFSRDNGGTWSAPLSPHPGSTLGGEHEFHSAWPTADGRLGLAWIDPRDQRVIPASRGSTEAQFLGAMQLMATTVSVDGTVARESVVDDVICECCPTAVALVRGQPVLAYRDKRVPTTVPRDSLRYEMTVLRDLSLARAMASAGEAQPTWRSGQRATEDNWFYNGCPNNGPSLAAQGDTVALAWWTGEGDTPRVQLRWSFDGGEQFQPPLRISDGRAEGQVAVALAQRGAYVAWLESDSVRLRYTAFGGAPGPIVTIGRADGRHRLPSLLARDGRGVLVAWSGARSRWEMREVDLASR